MTSLEITLVGATGYTGRLVAQALARRGVPFIAAGRSERALGELRDELGDLARTVRFRIVDLEQPAHVDTIVGPGRLVLSCAGPFNLIGRGLAERVASRGGAYVDVTGEEPFVAYLYEELDVIAKKQGALLVPSCAFESLPADMLAARLCASETSFDEISSYYRLARHAASPGTLLTMRLVPKWGTSSFRDGTFVRTDPGEVRRDAEVACVERSGGVAVFVPYPEVRFWGMRYETRAALSFMVLGRTEAALFGRSRSKGASTGSDGPAIEEIVAKHSRRGRPGPGSEERATQDFTVAVRATSTAGSSSTLCWSGADPYGVTAEIAAWVGRELADDGTIARQAGVRAPGEILDPDRFFDAATAWGCRLVE